jgi:hypothetical protein
MSAIRPFRLFAALIALAVFGAAGALVAQQSRDESPFDSGSSFEVGGIEVDVAGKDAASAREAAWRLAQRRGWAQLAQRLAGKRNATLPDSTLDSIVTGIVVEREEVGPNRYIARLGVMFDRRKAGGILGVSAQVTRSPPMLVIPVAWTGGAGLVFERDNPWQAAWGRFRSGNSAIDYLRPRGTGPDPLLMNAAQTGRRGRGWWREVLDEYGAADVLVPEVELRREYPGGPITAIFTASHGPDRTPITRFALRVNSGDALDALLDAGVKRIDQAYQDALASGLLKTDRLLTVRPPGEREEEEAPEEVAEPVDEPAAPPPAAPVETVTTFAIQVDTPDARALTTSEAALRGVPGVRSVTTPSLALGGISVMRVSYDGSIGSLRAALEARGWSVQQGAGTLRIRRPGAQPSPPPAQPPATDDTGDE